MVSLNRQERKKATRDLLLECAVKEFTRQGILATKTIDVAKAAGVAHGTLFLHFSTRDELLSEVIDRFGSEIGEEFRKLAERITCVRDLLHAMLRVIEKNEGFYSCLVVEGPLLPSDARNRIFVIQTGIALKLEKAMEEGIEDGRLRKLPLHLLVNSWLGMLNHYLANRDKFAPGGSVIARHGKELVEYFISLIVKKGES
jgi:AcrR family transcriptional regulator